ncbi:hypothetical protein MLD38_015155 [Melastoma candidum]|uniref:Uncharacterized protein n=1 Tax=Melastoma candidum TaxID=119954 RepID=A0ACB9RFA1_9MYRT|nr:hypothetical protein MLD38_015155 [Melastoma candidum]
MIDALFYNKRSLAISCSHFFYRIDFACSTQELLFVSSFCVSGLTSDPLGMMPKVSEHHGDSKVVMTAPLSLDGDSNDGSYVAPNILRHVLSLVNNVRPGSDLTRFQLPPMFNLPKSQLQLFGESAYCVASSDVLENCWKAETPLARFTSVVSWSISTTRPAVFGAAPYNPVLGETHHVSRGDLHFLLEQVSHHPPVSALHMTDDAETVEMVWCHQPQPRFYGASVETEVHGKRELRLLRLRETYVMNCPKLLIRLLPLPGINWSGPVRITCQESGLLAELSYGGHSLLGRNRRTVKGRILQSSSSTVLYEIYGHWDRTVTIKDINNGKTTEIYNARNMISRLKAPIIRDPKGILPTESAAVWSEVTEAILRKDWERAGEEKRAVEEKQRALQKQRESSGENWVPKHFNLSYNKEDGWCCSPLQRTVSPAPIEVLV